MAGTVWHPSAKRQQLEDAGPFTGGGHKFLVHTTEGTTLESAFETLKEKRSAPHFILEVKDGRRRLVQCIPINRAARGLERPHGTPETNHANCIQVEVVGFTDRIQAAKLGHLELWVPNWSTDIYKHLHLLMVWTHNHFAVPMRADHPFIGQPGYARLSPQAFIDAVGLVGHCHVANNNHTDPGPLNAHFVIHGPAAPFGPTLDVPGATTLAPTEALTPSSTILAAPRATRAQLRRHLIARHDANPGQSRYKDSTLANIVQLYDTTCKSIGLDPLVAVSQMELETGHLTSKASQPPRRNPAGIGITGPGVDGVSFANWNGAVRGHVGRLAAYAIPSGKGTPAQKALIAEALAVRPLNPKKRGVAARVAGLSRNWAADRDYAKKIVKIANEIRVA